MPAAILPSATFAAIVAGVDPDVDASKSHESAAEAVHCSAPVPVFETARLAAAGLVPPCTAVNVIDPGNTES